MTPQDARFDQLRTILADMTGNDAGDIHPDSDLVDDLSMTDTDLLRIVKQINKDFDIHLDATAVSDEVETVEDLLTIVTDEAELG